LPRRGDNYESFVSQNIGTGGHTSNDYSVEQIGKGNIRWASDFPHPDGIRPDSREYI
jgi:hypothetical protein